jgi:sugar/nucleoside kinase (ribokinase family)
MIGYRGDKPTAVFCAVMNVKGGLEIGVSDMEWLTEMPVEHIDNNKEIIQGAKILYVDTNLSPEVICRSLEYARGARWTIWEPISAEKSKKLLYKSILPSWVIIKPNDDQFEDLFRIICSQYNKSLDLDGLSADEIFKVKSQFIFEISSMIGKEYGIEDRLRYILVTCGAKGIKIVCREGLKLIHFSVKKIDNIVSANGAGDTFSGGFITGLHHFDETDEIKLISKAIRLGSNCSAKTILSAENISPEIRKDMLNEVK